MKRLSLAMSAAMVAVVACAADRMDRSKLQIGAYCLAQYARTDAHVKDLKDCGIDFIYGVPANDRATLDLCAKYGIGVIATGAVPFWHGMGGQQAGQMEALRPLSKYEEAMDAYKDHPAIWMLDYVDEPSALDYPWIAKVTKLMQTKAPKGVVPYINLYPNYASVVGNSAKQAVNQLGTKTYAEHVEAYMRNVPLDYVCFDFYVYSARGKKSFDAKMEKFHDNFRDLAEACHKYGKSLWYIPQVNSSYPELWLSENMLRFQAYLAMAYGAEQIDWACWSREASGETADMPGLTGWWTNNVLTLTGEKTEQYAKLKKVNAELHRLGGRYMKYRNVATRRVEKGAFVVGDMVGRKDAKAKAMFVLAAADPFDEKPGKQKFRFPAAEAKAHGGNGEVKVAREDDGELAVEIDSNSGVLIEYSYRASSKFVPQNEARVKEIASYLKDQPASLTPHISDRAYWDGKASKRSETKSKIKAAEAALTEPIPEPTEAQYMEFSTPGNGNRTHYEKPFFERVDRLENLLEAECLENKGRFLSRICDYLKAICSERTWCMPAHDRELEAYRGIRNNVDLGAQGRGETCARIIRVLRGVIDAETYEMVMRELERRIFATCRALTLVKDGKCSPMWWYQSHNNWTAVCHSGVVRAALTVLDDKMDRAAFIEAAERASKTFLSGFADDGYCSEGMGYWDYGWGHFLTLTLAVLDATNGKVNFCASEKARRVMDFGFNALLIKGKAASIADGGGKLDMKVVNDGVKIWPDLKVSGIDELPIRSAFPIAQMFIMRPGAEKAMPFALGVKGGNNAEFHNHNDVGTYDLFKDGVHVTGDPGGTQYTALTFSSRRYEIKMLSSYGHPLPVVDGELQSAGAEYRGRVLSRDVSDACDRISLNLTYAYDGLAAKGDELVRNFTYDRADRSVTVEDVMTFARREGTFSVPVVTPGKMVVTDRPGVYTIVVKEGEKDVVTTAEIAVEGSEWTVSEERIDNPLRVSPNRYAITLTKPVKTAKVRVTYR